MTFSLNIQTAEQVEATRLDAAKGAALAEMTTIISALRGAYITSLPGQEMIYLAKEAEARDWIAATAPDLADYPLLAAEAGLTAPDADQLAQLWLDMGALWRGAAAQIETLRLSAAAWIAAASTLAEVEAAMTGVRNA